GRAPGHRRQRGAQAGPQRAVPLRLGQEVQEVPRSGRMSDALVAWVGGAAATLLAFVGLWPWMTRNLNHKAFGEQIKKLILAGNGERAIKLCGAAPQSPGAVAVARTLAQRGRSEDLRDVYTSTLRAGLAGAGKLVWFAGGT